MRKIASITLVIALCCMIFFVLISCVPTSNSAGVVTVGTTVSVEKAVRGEYNYDMLASGNSEIPIVWQDAEGEYHPLLASYATTDSTTWTYTVCDGMTWSDGQPVTAEDILFTLQYEDATDGETNFAGESPKYISYKISDDDKTISLTLSSTNLRELADMSALRVMPKHIYENKTADQITEADGRVVCGPYILQNFDKNSGTLTYIVNEYYPQKPNVEKLVYTMFSNEGAMYTALQQGDIDAVWTYNASVPQTYAEVLEKDSNITLLSVAARNVTAVLMFNTSLAPLDDVNVRNAISYALNYKSFTLIFGGIVANRGFVPSTTVGYKETEQNCQNTQKATELLQQSGYTKNKDGKFEKDGKVLEFDLTVNSADADKVRYAESVKIQLEMFGIKVNLDETEKAVFQDKTSASGGEDKKVTMQAAIIGFTEKGMNFDDGLGTRYVDKANIYQGGCQVDDEKFETILLKMRNAKTPEEYNAAAGEMQDYYAESTPLIALFWKDSTYAHSAKLQGFAIDAGFGINNVQSWFSVTATE